MRFMLSERKTAQAAAVLLKAHGRPMSKLVLMKLLYLADRNSLKETGYPITGDEPYSLPMGPILSTVLDAINAKPVPPSFLAVWLEYITAADGNYIELRTPDPDTDELSQFELNVLNGVYTEFGGRSANALIKYTHDLPEWHDPLGSCIPIDQAEVLRDAGWSESSIALAEVDAEEHYLFDSVLASTG